MRVIIEIIKKVLQALRVQPFRRPKKFKRGRLFTPYKKKRHGVIYHQCWIYLGGYLMEEVIMVWS